MCISFSKLDVNLFVNWADYLKVNVKGIFERYRENGYIGSLKFFSRTSHRLRYFTCSNLEVLQILKQVLIIRRGS